jgi:predicted CopG family antitoxin
LDLREQNKVLDYIRSLLKSKRKERNFMVYHGSLDSKDANKIRKTIEDGCEKIDHNEW